MKTTLAAASLLVLMGCPESTLHGEPASDAAMEFPAGDAVAHDGATDTASDGPPPDGADDTPRVDTAEPAVDAVEPDVGLEVSGSDAAVVDATGGGTTDATGDTATDATDDTTTDAADDTTTDAADGATGGSQDAPADSAPADVTDTLQEASDGPADTIPTDGAGADCAPSKIAFDLDGEVLWDFFSVCLADGDQAAAETALQAIVPTISCGNISPIIAGCGAGTIACMGPELETTPGTHLLTEAQKDIVCAVSLLDEVASVQGGFFL